MSTTTRDSAATRSPGGACGRGDGRLLPTGAAPASKSWTPERDALLRTLWMQKQPWLSNRAIGKHLGVSKNAVTGRAYRLGLPDRASIMPPPERLAEARGDEIRAMAALGMSQREIAKRLCVRSDRVTQACKTLGIKVSLRGMKDAVAKSNKLRTRTRNQNLSEAQQEQLERMKNRNWRASLKPLPPVDDAEADALVRDWLARNRPTVCPPAAPVEIPTNAGAKWR